MNYLTHWLHNLFLTHMYMHMSALNYSQSTCICRLIINRFYHFVRIVQDIFLLSTIMLRMSTHIHLRVKTIKTPHILISRLVYKLGLLVQLLLLSLEMCSNHNITNTRNWLIWPKSYYSQIMFPEVGLLWGHENDYLKVLISLN